MKASGIILCLFTVAVFGTFSDAAPPRKLPGGWTLIWNDEFNGNSLDTTKWKPELGVIRNAGSQQTYTGRRENIRVEKGCLVLETRFERFKNIHFNPSGKGWIQQTEYMPYTSGSVTTKDTRLFHYGRLEVRAKLPKAKGIWPAIWLLGKNQWSWPANGEIDMMENISQEPNTVYSTFHMSRDGVSLQDVSKGGTVKIPHLPDDFHLYVMEWTPDAIRLMVDDKLVKSIDLGQTEYTGGAGNPFRTPFYLILNSAVGGEWCEKAPGDGAGYPVKFLVDYVRFYQTKELYEAEKNAK